MKTFKYILVIFILISLVVSGFSQDQTSDLKFLEAYTFGEFYKSLDQEDPFFQMVETQEREAESSKIGFCPESKVSKTWTYLNSPAFRAELPEDLSFVWGAEDDRDGKYLYALKDVSHAYSGPGRSDIAGIKISEGMLLMTFSEEGSEKWTELTKASLGKPIAIVINDLVYSAPMVREVIKGGNCAISGNFSPDELAELKAVLEN